MFKLYAYSYFNGIRSSRKIERECYRNIEVIWLINGLKPDFKTISDFRKNNKNQIKQAFHKFSMICDELGLIGKEMVAVDGSKFRASNSRFAYHSEKKIEKKIEHYNKVAVDDKYHLVVAVDVTSQPVDKEQLHNISLQAKEELNVDELTVIADKGYYSASEFAKCKEDNIIPIVSKADHAHMAATKEYGKSQFKYDEEHDGYVCPQGHLLKAYNHRKKCSEEKNIRRYQNFEACSNCQVKDKCSESEKGRTIQDRPFQRIADEVDRRTEEFSDMYKERKQMVEHPFGTIKRALGFSYFLTRRTENVRTESLLHFLVYNMKRAINIVGNRELVEILLG